MSAFSTGYERSHRLTNLKATESIHEYKQLTRKVSGEYFYKQRLSFQNAESEAAAKHEMKNRIQTAATLFKICEQFTIDWHSNISS